MSCKLTDTSHRINTLMKTNHKDTTLKLIKKILYSVNIKHMDIMNAISTNKTDKSIINHLIKLVKNPEPIYNSNYNTKKAHNKWKYFIKPNLPTNFENNIKNIFDFGGNVGDFAYIYGQYLNLKKKNIYVADVDDWAGEKWEPRNDITWIHASKLQKIPSNKIDLITIQHVMHHINAKKFSDLIEEFNRILTKNGVIVLYEHNTHNDNMSTIVDLEHLLFDVVVSKKTSYSNFLKTNYMEYFKINQWKKIFSKYFKSYKIIELNNLDNSFYMFLYRK